MPPAPIARVDVVLGGSLGPGWHRHGAAHVRGFAFVPGRSACLHAGALAAYLGDAPPDEAFARARALTGTFALVYAPPGGPEGAFALVDRIRSWPLFFARDGETLVLTDAAEPLARRIGSAPTDEFAIAEMLLSGSTTGRATLAPGVEGLRAGEALRVAGGRAWTERVYAYGGALDAPCPASEAPVSPAERARWVDEGVAALETAFARLVASAEGRPLVVPLSGGLDSRLVAAGLVRAGARPALCFSYGARRGYEAVRSAAVAERLGLPWAFVPYSARAWHRWRAHPEFVAFRRDASQLTAIEHEQDWPAVLALAARGAIPDGALFVPGHTGDFVAGAHLPPEAFAPEPGAPSPDDDDAALDPLGWLARRYYGLWPRRTLPDAWQRALRDRLAASLDGFDAARFNLARPLARAEAARAFEQSVWQERQAKMIVNSVRGYEAHGYGWRAPLWDAPVADFWPRVPLPERRQKRLFRAVAERFLGPLFSIPFTAPRRPRPLALLNVVLDAGYRRYGLFAGPAPELAALTRRVRHLVTPDDGEAIARLSHAWRNLPPQRVPLNGLLALQQVQATRRRFGL